LSESDPRLVQLVELRYFVGYLATVLQGEQEVAVVTVWGLTRTLDPLRDQMRKIAETGQWPNDSRQ